MKKRLLFFASLLLTVIQASAQQNNHKLIYNKPATQFEEALPLGNGRLGVMVYGGIQTERFSLNEATLWAGGSVNPDMNPQAKTYLKPVREALFAENYKKADSLVRFMQGKFSESYAPLGNLFFDFKHQGEPAAYQRELDIQNARSKVSYIINGTTYTRETFVSHPDQLVVVRFTATGKDKLDFTCHLNSLLQHKVSSNGKVLSMNGHSPVHVSPLNHGNEVIWDDVNAMRFTAQVKVLKTDGKSNAKDSILHISDAREAIIVLSMATSYNGFDVNPGTHGKNELKIAEAYLKTAAPYAVLLKNHTQDFRKYYDRVQLTLGDEDRAALNTVDRLNAFAAGKNDNALVALYYQYSRYLLISSSRPGGQSTNLQGIWNEKVQPPWSSNYTTNINAEMNYWGVETANLPEMHQPLLDFIGRLSKNGAVTARNYYGAGGWVLHHNSDIWAITNPVGDFGKGSPAWANWPMGGNWMATHLWEHYAFTQDKVYLKEQAYPLMKGAVQFCLDFLVADKKGNLLTAPSTSPENNYVTPSGYVGSLLYGGTADLAIIRELFNDYVKASELLNADPDVRNQVKTALKKMLPYHIGKAGNLQEWYHDWKDEDPKHRHLSHLFGAYPGYSITSAANPELANAVRKSLTVRTNEGTGWAITWRINLWARMQNGERAYDALKKLLRFVGNGAEVKMNGGGTYANLFCAHPPFQIDGNFGGGAGIAEMLLQSHQGYIELLPAIPVEWKQGQVKGLIARGGYTLDMQWENGKLISAQLKAKKAGDCKLKYGNKIISLSVAAGGTYNLSELL
ncbi:alpha-L-fucosidase 2 [Pedobacter cryoconitis]|uniref:Alpha-L-fucosidase 2 n=1 Tax=Pedobacter cryoconitis TaxID=188932 RepID=A0A7W9DHZ2_9SPHI|nr:glycoside hydrolase family 95 protein [Pedobacter cryoconitis]MBB5619507.1 alpha-L-fucosidase 2 [Pedobacter cryoconitis]